jgi:hypothetical protein
MSIKNIKVSIKNIKNKSKTWVLFLKNKQKAASVVFLTQLHCF